MMALIYIDAIVVMLSILMTDLLYVVVDPRISFESQGVGQVSTVRKPTWTSSGSSFARTAHAYWALWLLLPLFLVAIFAPAIASDRPFVFVEADGQHGLSLVPRLVQSEESIDFVFNMALVGFVPWLVLCALTEWYGRRPREAPRRRASGRTAPRPRPRGIGLANRADAPGVPGADRRAVGRPGPEDLRPAESLIGAAFVSRRRVSQPRARMAGIRRSPTDRPRPTLGRVSSPPIPQAGRLLAQSATRASSIWLGTDDTGRDVLTLMIYGTRISHDRGLRGGEHLSSRSASFVGAVAGYFGGTADILISRVDRSRAAVPLVLSDLDAGGHVWSEHLHHHDRDRHHRLADGRPADSRRGAQAALDRLHDGGPGAGLVASADRVSAHPAQLALAGAGGARRSASPAPSSPRPA